MTGTKVSITRTRRSLLLGAAVAALLIVLHFYQPEQRGLWARTFFDALHVPVFGLIALGIYAALPARLHWKRVAVAFLATAFLGLLSELAQIATVRDASVRDFVADLLGAAGFLAAVVAVSEPLRTVRFGRLTAAVAAFALLAIPLVPLARVSLAYVERNALAPVLVDPGARFAGTFIRRQNARVEFVPAAAGNAIAARVSFGNGPWPGVAFHDIWPDWRRYDAVVLVLSSATGETFEINLRVHDDKHAENDNAYTDRFTTRISIPLDRTEVGIPLADIASAPRDREMDLSAIAEIIVFGTTKDAGRSFYIHEVRLE